MRVINPKGCEKIGIARSQVIFAAAFSANFPEVRFLLHEIRNVPIWLF